MSAATRSGNSGPRPGVSRRRRFFARRAIYPGERPSIYRKHIYTGAMGNVYFMLASGIVFAFFVKEIGMDGSGYAFMGAVSAFLLSFQLISALFTQKGGRRKRIWFWTSLVCRSARGLGILLGFLLWQVGYPSAGVAVMVGSWVASFFGALSMPPWMSWLADIVPEKEHGTFMGRRDQWIAGTVMLSGVVAGLLMDYAHEDHKVYMAFVILVSAVVVGILDVVIHGTIPEPHMPNRHRGRFLEQVMEPLRDRGFRPWLVFTVFWSFSMWMGGVVFMPFIVGPLGMEKSFLGGMVVMMCMSQMASLWMSGRTGKLVDKLGPKRVLRWGHFFWSLNPIFLFLAEKPTALYFLALNAISGGVACKAAMNASNKLVTRFPKPGHRAMYIAVSSCLGCLAGALGALVASGILKVCDGWEYSLWGKTIIGFHVVLLLSLVLRLATTGFLLGRINNPETHAGESATGEVAGQS